MGKKSNKKEIESAEVSNIENVEMIENVETENTQEIENTDSIENENTQMTENAEPVELLNPIEATLEELEYQGIKINEEQLKTIIEIYSERNEAWRKRQKNKPSLLSTAIDALITLSKNDEEIRAAGMNCKEICDYLLTNGLYHTDGKTPEQSLYTAIIRYIEKEGENAKIIKSRVKGLWKVNKAVVSLD